MVSVDLRHRGVRVVGTPESLLDATETGHTRVWRTTTEFARAVGADVAINANYYDIFSRAFSTCGLTVTQGRTWTSTYADRRLECWASIGFGSHGRVALFDSHGKIFGPVPETWMTDVVTGSPRVLANGEVLRYTTPRHALSRNPRTLVGVDATRSTLYLMVVNGREGANKGMTCPEAARVLRDFGASDAINLDGGGSSTLYVRAEGGLVTHTPDGVERPVGNHLGIVLDAPDAPNDDPPKPPLRAAVEHPSLAAQSAQRARGPAAPPRPAAHAGCQSTPTSPSAPVAWGLLAFSVLVAVSRRSPLERLRAPTRARATRSRLWR
jgi:MYXO-CTERM domain-containing protein